MNSDDSPRCIELDEGEVFVGQLALEVGVSKDEDVSTGVGPSWHGGEDTEERNKGLHCQGWQELSGNLLVSDVSNLVRLAQKQQADVTSALW